LDTSRIDAIAGRVVWWLIVIGLALWCMHLEQEDVLMGVITG
jgi:hypothetical protein